VNPKGGGNREEKRAEVGEEATAAQKASTESGSLDVLGDLRFGQLDLAVHEDRKVAADRCHELTEALIVDRPAARSNRLAHRLSCFSICADLPGAGTG
jgi:hypothetical protein